MGLPPPPQLVPITRLVADRAGAGIPAVMEKKAALELAVGPC